MSTLSVQPLIEAFLDSLWFEKGLSQNTLKSYRHDLQAYADWLETKSQTFTQVSRADINQYLSHRLQKGL